VSAASLSASSASANSDALNALRAHAATLPTLKELFATDAARATRDCLALNGLHVDFSKQRLSVESYRLLEQFAQSQQLKSRISAMFAGEAVNGSEQRQVLHGLLRTPLNETSTALAKVRAQMQREFDAMQKICTAIHSGRASELGLVQPKTIVNIGIGGSDLGPRLVVDALSHHRVAGLDVRFITNVDAHHTQGLLDSLDPDQTVFVIVSKSFSTQETKLNAELARAWIAAHYRYRCLEPQFDRHFITVSSNVAAAKSFGINPELVLGMSEAVGGRYSLWSSVGLSIALAIGWANFSELLGGAYAADQNYQHADDAHNVARRLALVEYFNRSVLNHATRCVVPYDDRLGKLAEFLQQLEMESNGKGVSGSGAAIGGETVPVVWGGVGTNVQHAFFQAIHQGTQIVPMDFVGVKAPDHSNLEMHQVLLANLLAQSAALLAGKSYEQALTETTVNDAVLRESIAKQRVFTGNRPSTTFLFERLTPAILGTFIAVLENKTHALSVLWGVNAFDQWGVELGKVLANALLPAVQGLQDANGFDASTQNLLKLLRS
jgi:glucose-6-phosphate isomerase